MRKYVWMLIGFMVIACAHRNGDIERVEKPYWDKSYFHSKWEAQGLSPDEWYYRYTVIDVPTNSKAASIGSGNWLNVETLRFEITKDYLIGYRSDALVPGSEGETGKKTYKGAPVVVFAITDHFDILREADAETGAKSNVIAENTTRPWEKRRFFRVDFSRNLVSSLEREDVYGALWAGASLENSTTHWIENNDPSNSKRFRFEEDYFDFTTRQGVKMDLLSYVGAYGSAFRYDSGAPVVDVRHSFLKKKTSDYEPLDYPDFVTLKGKTDSALIPINEKFGFFRTNWSGRATFDPRYGELESQKTAYIARFNIWKKVRDAGGNLIPIKERKTKPIIYYMNVEHPESLKQASKKVEKEWNRVFKEVVFLAQKEQYQNLDQVPDMWILRENDCHIENVIQYVHQHPELKEHILHYVSDSLEDLRAQIYSSIHIDQGDYTEILRQEMEAKKKLEQICSILEHDTQGKEYAFAYQRNGDLRYNLLNVLVKRSLTDWSGLGPMFADPKTGETLSATANVNLWYLDEQAAKAVDQVWFLKGKLDIGDMILGHGVWEKGPRVIETRSHEALLNRLSFDTQQWALDPITSNWSEERLNRLEGTKSQSFVSKNLLQLPHTQYAELGSLKHLKSHEEHLKKQAYLPMDGLELVDRLVMGSAMQCEELSKKECFKKIREGIFTAVMLHEVGHNMGLAHNMEGSSDVLNYGERFWELESMPSDIQQALAELQLPKEEETRKILKQCLSYQERLKKLRMPNVKNITLTTQDCLGQQEAMYSSIMDYHSRWNSDTNGLGAYDKAAIQFGYAQILEVFKADKVSSLQKDMNLSRWLFLNDWRKIPKVLFKDKKDINDRDYIVYEWDRNHAKKAPPELEVPYRFCMDPSGFLRPTCKAFDMGADMMARSDNYESQYWNYYYKSHFSMGRLWDLENDGNRAIMSDLTIMSDYTNLMKWYYYYQTHDPEFAKSDAGKDYLLAVLKGLNHFSHVIGHPTPGVYVKLPNYILDRQKGQDPTADPFGLPSLLHPLESLEGCDTKAVTVSFFGVSMPAPNNVMFHIPLGPGRPFYVGFGQDYEELYVNYMGSLYSKLYAGYFLGESSASFPKTQWSSKPETYAVSWYQLFPKEVSRLMGNLILDRLEELGPLMDPSGQLVQRDLIDLETLQAPDYAGYMPIRPKTIPLLSKQAALYGAALMSGHMNGHRDFMKSMQVVREGSPDRLAFDEKGSFIEFEHPLTQNKYMAARSGEYPVAYELLKHLNLLKDRYVRLSACVEEEKAEKHPKDPFCQCVKVEHKGQDGHFKCCETMNQECQNPTLEKPGEGFCTLQVLEARAHKAKEELELSMGLLENIRFLNQTYSRF